MHQIPSKRLYHRKRDLDGTLQKWMIFITCSLQQHNPLQEREEREKRRRKSYYYTQETQNIHTKIHCKVPKDAPRIEQHRTSSSSKSNSVQKCTDHNKK